MFGKSIETETLDFFADHVRYEYNHNDEQLIDITTPNCLEKLASLNLLIKKGEYYQLNIKNPIIASILKFDFEQGKKELHNKN